MSLVPDRRQFLQASAVSGIGYWITGAVQAAESKSTLEQIQVGCIGVRRQGPERRQEHVEVRQDFRCLRRRFDRARRHGQKCLQDPSTIFTDYREMLDKLGDRIDAVTISVPDHNHAVMAAKAMKMGKHVHCQKPLTHSIWEARRLGEIARETGVATQMGNQGTAGASMRKAAYQIRAARSAQSKEVHVWTNRPIWPQGGHRPHDEASAKDARLGSLARPRALAADSGEGYHPFAWRGWWDFGTGALGDMACHTCNMPFMALNMRDPISVEAECPEHDGDSYPKWSKIKYEFPELDGRPAFTMHWYDGGKVPPTELF